MSILGNRVVRKEDPKFLTSGGTYVDDLKIDGAARVTYVRSTSAHARIRSVDIDEARSAPGVLAVVTAADIELDPLPLEMPMLNEKMPQPWLATDVVRYVGEPVVAIVSETQAEGADAAELIFIDYEPLPVLVDTEGALEGSIVLHPEAGTNVSFELQLQQHR